MQYSKEVEMHSTGDVFLSQFVTALRKPTKNLSQKTLTLRKSFSGFLFPVGSAHRDITRYAQSRKVHPRTQADFVGLFMIYRYDLAIVANLIIIKRLGISKLS